MCQNEPHPDRQPCTLQASINARLKTELIFSRANLAL